MHYISTACLGGENSKFTRDIFKVLNVYAKAGIKNIELGAAHEPFDNVKDLFKYKKENNANFIIHYNFPCAKNIKCLLNISSLNEEIAKTSLRVIKNGIELCNELEAPIYSMHPGFTRDLDLNLNPITKPITREKAVQLMTLRMQEVMDFARDYDVKIAVENMVSDCISFCNAEDFLKLFNKIKNKRLGILLDIGHMKMAHPNLEEQKDFVEKIKDKIFELHLHEVINEKDHNKLTNVDILKPFNINTKNIALTLEINGATIKDILDSQEVLKKIAAQ